MPEASGAIPSWAGRKRVSLCPQPMPSQDTALETCCPVQHYANRECGNRGMPPRTTLQFKARKCSLRQPCWTPRSASARCARARTAPGRRRRRRGRRPAPRRWPPLRRGIAPGAQIGATACAAGARSGAARGRGRPAAARPSARRAPHSACRWAGACKGYDIKHKLHDDASGVY